MIMKWWNIRAAAMMAAWLLAAGGSAANEGGRAETDGRGGPATETAGMKTPPSDSTRVIVGEKEFFVDDSTAVMLGKYLSQGSDGGRETGRYERIALKRVKRWLRLLPNHSSVQFAGNVGLVSLGPGWHYGRKEQWETDLLIGILPKYNSEEVRVTFTTKQRFTPWRIDVSSRWTVEPLTTGVFFNTITGGDFWANEPDKYPKSYYGFSTRIRANVFVGQRIKYKIPTRLRRAHSSVSFYYEISAGDLDIVSKATNSAVPLRDVLALALGLRWEFF